VVNYRLIQGAEREKKRERGRECDLHTFARCLQMPTASLSLGGRKRKKDRQRESGLHTFARCLQMPTASLSLGRRKRKKDRESGLHTFARCLQMPNASLEARYLNRYDTDQHMAGTSFASTFLRTFGIITQLC